MRGKPWKYCKNMNWVAMATRLAESDFVPRSMGFSTIVPPVDPSFNKQRMFATPPPPPTHTQKYSIILVLKLGHFVCVSITFSACLSVCLYCARQAKPNLNCYFLYLSPFLSSFPFTLSFSFPLPPPFLPHSARSCPFYQSRTTMLQLFLLA